MASPLQLPGTWDAVAAGYAESVGLLSSGLARAALDLAPPTATDRVLDVACGPGAVAFAAASTCARVVAIDFSPGMIAELAGRAAREGVKNVEGVVMDARTLLFDDASFDRAYCVCGFMFFPDRARVFAELHRVLRPGGTLVMATWAPIAKRPAMKIGFDALAVALPEFPPPAKGDLQLPEECITEMTAGGFSDVRAVSHTASSRAESPEKYLEVMERSGAPFAAIRAKIGPDAWAAAQMRMLEEVKKSIPEGGCELAAEAILTVGTRAPDAA